MNPRYPVMAALLAAIATHTQVVFANAPGRRTPPPAVAPAPAVSVPDDCSVLLSKDKDPKIDKAKDNLKLLQCWVDKNTSARSLIATRMTQFLQTQDKSKKFIYSQAEIAGLPDAVKKWVQGAKSSDLAYLYFVVGPGGDTSGFKGTPLEDRKFPPKAIHKRFLSGLEKSGWTNAKKNQIKDVDGIPKFFDGAVSLAAAAIKTDAQPPQVKKGEMPGDKTKEDVVAVVAGGGNSVSEGNSNSLVNDAMAQARSETLERWEKYRAEQRVRGINLPDSYLGTWQYYIDGAVVQNIVDSKGEFRTVSVKIYSTRDSKGDPINGIGIVDITPNDNRAPRPPLYLEINRTSSQEVSLMGNNGARKYKITVSEFGEVKIALSEDLKPKTTSNSIADILKGKKADVTPTVPNPDSTMTTSISALHAARNQQIERAGLVTIGGQPFYMIVQGGSMGSVLFFPKDRFQKEGPLHPALLAKVIDQAADGHIVDIQGKPSLGKYNGQEYHLENGPKGWEVKEGEGDKPKENASNNKDSDTTGAKASASASSSGGAASPADTKAFEQQIADIESGKVEDKMGWKQDESNKKLTAEMRSKIRIMRSADGGAHILFGPGGPAELGLNLKTNVRGFKNYVAIESNGRGSYYDYDGLGKVVSQTDTGSDNSFNGTFLSDIRDADVAVDALQNIAKQKTPNLEEKVNKAIKDHAKDGKFWIKGRLEKGSYIAEIDNGQQVCQFLPVEAKCKKSGRSGHGDSGDGDPKPAKEKIEVAVDGKPAAGVEYDNCVLPSEESDKIKYKVHTDKDATKVGPAKGSHFDDACLYDTMKNDKNIGLSIMIRFVNNKGTSKTDLRPIFGTEVKRPANFSYQSIGSKDIYDRKNDILPKIVFLTNSDDKRGVYAMVRKEVAPGTNTALKGTELTGNCLGPIVWWGMNKDQAKVACEKGSL